MSILIKNLKKYNLGGDSGVGGRKKSKLFYNFLRFSKICIQ